MNAELGLNHYAKEYNCDFFFSLQKIMRFSCAIAFFFFKVLFNLFIII